MYDIVNELIAGDTLDFIVSLPDYPASDGWVLTFSLRGPSVINLTATASGKDHHVQADSSTSAAWLPGDYTWVSTVSKAGQRYTVDSAKLKILPDITQAVAGYDGRTTAKVLLDAIEAVLMKRATRSDLEYEVGGRRFKSMTHGELLAARDKLRIEVAQEERAARIASGLPAGNRVLVRFG